MYVNPKPLIYPPYPHISPLVTISVFSVSVRLFRLHNKSMSSFVSLLKNQIPHVGDMVFAFVWLISLSMIISRSIHVAANGIIPFFLWLSNVLSRSSCLTLCNPLDYSPPGSSVHGILQARTLEWAEWAAMPSSKGPTVYIYIYIYTTSSLSIHLLMDV